LEDVYGSVKTGDQAMYGGWRFPRVGAHTFDVTSPLPVNQVPSQIKTRGDTLYEQPKRLNVSLFRRTVGACR